MYTIHDIIMECCLSLPTPTMTCGTFHRPTPLRGAIRDMPWATRPLEDSKDYINLNVRNVMHFFIESPLLVDAYVKDFSAFKSTRTSLQRLIGLSCMNSL